MKRKKIHPLWVTKMRKFIFKVDFRNRKSKYFIIFLLIMLGHVFDIEFTSDLLIGWLGYIILNKNIKK